MAAGVDFTNLRKLQSCGRFSFTEICLKFYILFYITFRVVTFALLCWFGNSSSITLLLKPSCHRLFTRAFSKVHSVVEVITLVRSKIKLIISKCTAANAYMVSALFIVYVGVFNIFICEKIKEEKSHPKNVRK